MTKSVNGYSPIQVALHWAVVVLVAFQFVAHDGIEDVWHGFVRNEGSSESTNPLAYMHIGAGVLVLILALIRIYLRLTRGAPPPPKDEPQLLHIVAEAVHSSIYFLLLMLPITGMVAWLFLLEIAGDIHEWLQTLLLVAITLHVAGALFQHFVRRSEVLMRMFKPESS